MQVALITQLTLSITDFTVQAMATQEQHADWVPLRTSLKLIFTNKRLFFWSAFLVCATIFLSWLGYLFSVDYIDHLVSTIMPAKPEAVGVWGWIKYAAWVTGDWLYLFVSRIVSFFAAFLLAYTLTTPGYAFLSAAAEKVYAGEFFDADAAMSLAGIVRDIVEGLKIALFGILITIASLFLNFIPVIGQATVFLVYCYYSTLMFIDYPASRRRWHLGQKLYWMRKHSSSAFRLGVGPALISLIPLVNIFAMALIFPVLTVHASINFSAIEVARKRYELMKS